MNRLVLFNLLLVLFSAVGLLASVINKTELGTGIFLFVFGFCSVMAIVNWKDK